ncbi:MAG: DUF3080 family protein [Marinobacter sp.]
MPEIRKLIVPLFCVYLTGCTSDSDVADMMDDYVAEVAEALELSPELSEISPVSQIPRRRERVLDMPDLDMGMLDFFSLYGCELQYVVGERNSIMGKVMQPLNRLRYETRFMRAAEDCLPETEREGVKEKLEEAIESKADTLPLAVWNATWGVEEVERLFTRSQGYYPRVSDETPVAALAADIERLNRTVAGLLGGNSKESLGYIGEVHQRWQAEYRAGQLMNSVRLLTTRLDDGSALLAERVENAPLCANGEPDNARSRLRSAYADGYDSRVKSYLEGIGQAREALAEPLDELATMQADTMPEAFRDWYRENLDTDGAGSLWGQLDQAIEMHTRRWQQILDQCGLSKQA